MLFPNSRVGQVGGEIKEVRRSLDCGSDLIPPSIPLQPPVAAGESGQARWPGWPGWPGLTWPGPGVIGWF